MRAGYTRLFSLTLAVLVLPAGALAASSHKDKNKTAQHADHSSCVDAHVAVGIFVDKDRDVIRHYYAGQPGNLPPAWQNAVATCLRGLRSNCGARATCLPGSTTHSRLSGGIGTTAPSTQARADSRSDRRQGGHLQSEDVRSFLMCVWCSKDA